MDARLGACMGNDLGLFSSLHVTLGSVVGLVMTQVPSGGQAERLLEGWKKCGTSYYREIRLVMKQCLAGDQGLC